MWFWDTSRYSATTDPPDDQAASGGSDRLNFVEQYGGTGPTASQPYHFQIATRNPGEHEVMADVNMIRWAETDSGNSGAGWGVNPVFSAVEWEVNSGISGAEWVANPGFSGLNSHSKQSSTQLQMAEFAEPASYGQGGTEEHRSNTVTRGMQNFEYPEQHVVTSQVSGECTTGQPLLFGMDLGCTTGPTCSEVVMPPAESNLVLDEHQGGGTPLSPISERYRLKQFHLQQKYDYVFMSNNRLRNRLYHIKKEINHLKRLKRVLCQRLFTYRDPFMDSCLEIPDNEPTTSAAEKASNDTPGKPSSSSKKRKAADVKRVNQQANEVSSMAEIAKNSIISIIDSVITESHEERVRANQNSNVRKASQQSSTNASLNDTKARNGKDTSNVAGKGESLIERMLRASSIDHLLPMDPDSDPNNVLTGFGENLEENFMAED